MSILQGWQKIGTALFYRLILISLMQQKTGDRYGLPEDTESYFKLLMKRSIRTSASLIFSMEEA